MSGITDNYYNSYHSNKHNEETIVEKELNCRKASNDYLDIAGIDEVAVKNSEKHLNFATIPSKLTIQRWHLILICALFLINLLSVLAIAAFAFTKISSVKIEYQKLRSSQEKTMKILHDHSKIFDCQNWATQAQHVSSFINLL